MQLTRREIFSAGNGDGFMAGKAMVLQEETDGLTAGKATVMAGKATVVTTGEGDGFFADATIPARIQSTENALCYLLVRTSFLAPNQAI